MNKNIKMCLKGFHGELFIAYLIEPTKHSTHGQGQSPVPAWGGMPSKNRDAY